MKIALYEVNDILPCIYTNLHQQLQKTLRSLICVVNVGNKCSGLMF